MAARAASSAGNAKGSPVAVATAPPTQTTNNKNTGHVQHLWNSRPSCSQASLRKRSACCARKMRSSTVSRVTSRMTSPRAAWRATCGILKGYVQLPHELPPQEEAVQSSVFCRTFTLTKSASLSDSALSFMELLIIMTELSVPSQCHRHEGRALAEAERRGGLPGVPRVGRARQQQGRATPVPEAVAQQTRQLRVAVRHVAGVVIV